MKIKKYGLVLFLSYLHVIYCSGQVTPQEMANRKHNLLLAGSDTAKVTVLLTISGGYRFSNIDSALYYNDQALSLSRKADWANGEARALSDKGSIFLESGDIPNSLKYLLAALDIADKIPDPHSRTSSAANIENRIGNVYMELGEYKTSLIHYRASLALARKIKSGIARNEISNIGNDYELMGLADSARFYFQTANDGQFAEDTEGKFFVWAEMRQRQGNLESDLGHYNAALTNYRQGIHDAIATNDLRNLSVLYLKMGMLFKKLKVSDSSFFYARKTIATSRQVLMKKSAYEASELLSSLFELQHQPDSALFYAKFSANVKDDLYGPKIFRQLQLITLQEQQRQQQLQEENDRLRYKYLIGAMVAALCVFLLIAIILYRNNRQKHSANKVLETTLTNLKNTQTQLIQSEKMASLGELTAGIAHEIQNPLNFVNNFSDVNREMLEELKAESIKPKVERDAQMEIDLLNDLIANESKINLHGKRADAIVKGMLQHSQTGKGTKEPTDINALSEERMLLAYHAMQSKNADFYAEMSTSFDAGLPKVSVIPQDISKVLLNLFNNAFYAVNQKQKTAGTDYKPEVSVSTYLEKNNLVIKVKDNGNGIPDAIKDKIMQPFFTTKPTGEGTGLGLSLSYDIVVKGHGGSLTVEGKEGEGSEFKVNLPIKG